MTSSRWSRRTCRHRTASAGRGRWTRARCSTPFLSLLRRGCPWRLLPKDFPPRSTVFGYFRRLWEDGTWPTLHAVFVMAARERAGKEASPTAGIIDSQSVRTTESGGPKGYDAGKKVNGRKRHVLVDTLGLLLVLAVHTADVQDRDGLALVCRRLRRRSPWLRLIFADTGYRGETAACAAAREGLRLEIVTRDPGTRGFAVLPRRWVVLPCTTLPGWAVAMAVRTS